MVRVSDFDKQPPENTLKLTKTVTKIKNSLRFPQFRDLSDQINTFLWTKLKLRSRHGLKI